MEEETNCDGQWESEMEKGKKMRKRERKEGTDSWAY